jgi:tetraacyldisaccharide 4'-kinase
MRRLRRLLGPLFSPVDRLGVQGERDRDRLAALGIDPARIAVTGNLKYESPEPPRKPELEVLLRELAGDRPLLLAGSTMAGEEEAVLDAFREAGGAERALLVLAPRHPERWNEVAALLHSRGTDFVRRSAQPPAMSGPSGNRPAVVLLDSLGELAGLYRLAAAAFIGGTLVPTGGHNPLEAARFGVPIAAGPSMHNFRDMAEAFDRAGAWRRVRDAGELAAVWREWLADSASSGAVGERGLRLVEENRGALARTLAMLEPILGKVSSPRPSPHPLTAGREGTGLKAPSPPVSPWQLLYGGAHRLRRRWYRDRARRLPRPVVSVGNLLWGGAGKTPLAAAVAAHLRDRGLAVCILSRGYGRRERGVRVVSTGQGPLFGPRLAGDEPVLLAGELPGVAVVVGADRHQAGLQALHRLEPQPDLFVLDDGFSHLKLHRDLDLVAFPAADPFGKGRLLPSGRLREPLAAVNRAHAVVMTGLQDFDGSGAALAEALRAYGFTGPGFTSVTRPGAPRRIGGGELSPGRRVLLVTAIANPDLFTETVRRQGLAIAGELRFPDHHRYPAASLARIVEAWRRSGADAVLTTSKDRVKLHGRLDAPLAELPIRAEPEPAFWEWLDGALGSLF